MRLLKLYLELDYLLMHKQWIDTKKWWLKKNKTMKAYFKAVMLSLKIYENILDILTVCVNALKWSFIDVKKNKVYGKLWPR